ncbi:MAG TPA: hypothetical protein VKV27_16535 [Solirubrobacteraceae bacterium]|nr:hypothetical protein [Solirubrobacteraceae bacterium]
MRARGSARAELAGPLGDVVALGRSGLLLTAGGAFVRIARLGAADVEADGGQAIDRGHRAIESLLERGAPWLQSLVVGASGATRCYLIFPCWESRVNGRRAPTARDWLDAERASFVDALTVLEALRLDGIDGRLLEGADVARLLLSCLVPQDPTEPVEPRGLVIGLASELASATRAARRLCAAAEAIGFREVDDWRLELGGDAVMALRLASPPSVGVVRSLVRSDWEDLQVTLSCHLLTQRDGSLHSEAVLALRCPGPWPDDDVLFRGGARARRLLAAERITVAGGEYRQRELWRAALPLGPKINPEGEILGPPVSDPELPLQAFGCGSATGIPLGARADAFRPELFDPWEREHDRCALIVCGDDDAAVDRFRDGLTGELAKSGLAVIRVELTACDDAAPAEPPPGNVGMGPHAPSVDLVPSQASMWHAACEALLGRTLTLDEQGALLSTIAEVAHSNPGAFVERQLLTAALQRGAGSDAPREAQQLLRRLADWLATPARLPDPSALADGLVRLDGPLRLPCSDAGALAGAVCWTHCIFHALLEHATEPLRPGVVLVLDGFEQLAAGEGMSSWLSSALNMTRSAATFALLIGRSPGRALAPRQIASALSDSALVLYGDDGDHSRWHVLLGLTPAKAQRPPNLQPGDALWLNGRLGSAIVRLAAYLTASHARARADSKHSAPSGVDRADRYQHTRTMEVEVS